MLVCDKYRTVPLGLTLKSSSGKANRSGGDARAIRLVANNSRLIVDCLEWEEDLGFILRRIAPMARTFGSLMRCVFWSWIYLRPESSGDAAGEDRGGVSMKARRFRTF